MLQMKIKTGRRSVVPGDLPSILGARRAYRELGDMVEALIAQMDMLAGDCDEEDDDPAGGNILDQAHDQDGILKPIYGLDHTAGPLNYEHSREIYEAAENVRLSLRPADMRLWQRRIEQIGAFDPVRHGQTMPGYDV